MTANEDKVFYDHAPLSDFTTFQLGGKCRALLQCSSEEALLGVMREIQKRRERHVVLGGGSNAIFLDKGIEATIVRYYDENTEIKQYGNYLVVPASCPLDKLALFAAENGLSGLEFANGIPGTLGGAIAGNAGAFGRSISDVINSVRIFTQQCTVREVTTDQMKFGYRKSRLRSKREVALSAFLALQEGNRDELLAERERILKLRREKHPDWHQTPCAGSIFKNIEDPNSTDEKKVAAGYLLDQVGAKDMKEGGAQVFEKHANIIIKASDDCTSEDVTNLALRMHDAVKEKFGISLVPEVQFYDNTGGQRLLFD
jgi:UDP-N-acetylmuramate dehydrogenase